MWSFYDKSENSDSSITIDPIDPNLSGDQKKLLAEFLSEFCIGDQQYIPANALFSRKSTSGRTFIQLTRSIVCRASSNNPLEKRYEVVGKLIGQGGNGYVSEILNTISITNNDSIHVKKHIDAKKRIVKCIAITKNRIESVIKNEEEISRQLRYLHAKKLAKAGYQEIDVFGDPKTNIFLVAKYFDGQPLAELFNMMGDGIERRLTLTINLLMATHKIHMHLIQHNDIFDCNILVNPETLDVYIIDFGAAANLESMDMKKRQIAMKIDVISISRCTPPLWWSHDPNDPRRKKAGELVALLIDMGSPIPIEWVIKKLQEMLINAKLDKLNMTPNLGENQKIDDDKLQNIRQLLAADLNMIPQTEETIRNFTQALGIKAIKGLSTQKDILDRVDDIITRYLAAVSNLKKMHDKLEHSSGEPKKRVHHAWLAQDLLNDFKKAINRRDNYSHTLDDIVELTGKFEKDIKKLSPRFEQLTTQINIYRLSGLFDQKKGANKEKIVLITRSISFRQ